MKFILILSLFLGLFLFAGLNVSLSAETIRFGLFQKWPILFTDEQGNPQGIVNDVLKLMATHENWQIEYIACKADDCLELLKNGSIDLMCPVADKTEKELDYEFGKEVFLTNWAQIYSNSAEMIHSIFDLEGKRIAVIEKAEVTMNFRGILQSFNIVSGFVYATDIPTILKFIDNKEADAGIVDRFSAFEAKKFNQINETSIVFNPIAIRFAGTKVKENNFLKVIDKYLIQFKNDNNSIYYKSLLKFTGTEDKNITPKWLKWLVISILILFVLLILINLILKNQVSLKTQKLIQEIANHKKTLKLLKESEKLFRFAFDNANDGVALVELNQKIIRVNKQICEILGYFKEELEQKYVYEVTFADDVNITADFIQQNQRGLSDKAIYEKRFIHKDGQIIWCLVSTAIISGELDRPSYMISHVRDINQQKKVEEENRHLEANLRKTHKMQALGTLASGIAHDFNNILSIIFSNIFIAMKKLPDHSPARERLEIVMQAGERAKDLVYQILSFSKVHESHSFSPIRIQSVLEEAINFLRASIPSSIKIESHIDISCGNVLCDPSQIHQVIMNLCTNAAHAMEESGGLLDIKLTEVILTSSDFEPGFKQNSGKYALLSVSDTGHGISEEIIDQIFDPYFSTKDLEKGSGLGLTVVQGIIQNHKGFIQTESKINHGSSFQIFLPVVSEKIEKPGITKIISLRKGNEKIMFVDDEQMIVDIGKEILEDLGYKVFAYNNSQKAFEVFAENPEDFDLIITDQTMPELSGAELARKVLKIRPDMPIILVTGFSEKIDEVKAEKIGIREYAMKPLSQSDLANLIRKNLDNR